MLQPVASGYIEIKTAAIGLDRGILMTASGQMTVESDALMLEYAGVVTKVWSGVGGLSQGDRVYGVGKGILASHQRVTAAFSQKLGPADDFNGAATMPLSFMSAIYAFEHIARLTAGQRVLIHNASEGLGLAAIQVARSKRAQISATVGAADEAQILFDAVGMSKEEGILNEPIPKGGFHVILSSAASGGESLYQDMSALASMGQLIVVGGGADILETQEIHLGQFKKNTQLSSFDLGSVLQQDIELGARLMRSVQELHRAGHIAPISPCSVYDVSKLDEAIRNTCDTSHTGKSVVSFQDSSSPVKMLRRPQEATFDPNAVYLVTGGFGGLGRGIVRWMADRGAHHIAILSRRGAVSSAAKLLLEDMQNLGVHIEAMACDVTKRHQMMRVIEHISTSSRPIRGVIHAVLFLSDLSLDKQTIDTWRAGTAAKTFGTMNLHEATLKQPLDFFVTLTSTETIWAPATQAAYMAADSFATYFARFRRHLGLPASTVSYGFISDVKSDFRATSHGTEDMYARNLALTMTECQALAALEPAFLSTQPEGRWTGQQHDPLSAATHFTCLNPLELAAKESRHVPRWHRDARVSLLMGALRDQRRLTTGRDNETKHDGDGGTSAQRLSRAFDEAINKGPSARHVSAELVTNGISRAVAEMLFIDPVNVDPNKSVADHGVDSLIAAELRSWFLLALRVNTKHLLDSKLSIKELAGQIVDDALRAG